MRRSILLAAITSLAISACAHRAVVPELPLPPRPARPHVAPAELQCLSADVYSRLVQRERLGDAHIERLENIIKSTTR